MARFIIIDVNSGYIFGDTADFAANQPSEITPEEACMLLDASLMQPGGHYVRCDERSSCATYLVYRADIAGGEAIPVVTDGQDRETIEAVEDFCSLVCGVERVAPEHYSPI